ncbi:DUF3192 domain-containing protein [Agaribacter marinus]|uniref:DUF3192 domain-containing protein n=1 Tax=Agaribacter marinus TaxID=1431249 RepID=A0AA37SZH0_9ALTE|nr:DUF3192 domain-containing protein [Agaribacter marinus]GLR70845.1 hypothetical protein GCM10007852_17530 [Agaribacter marinus]
MSKLVFAGLASLFILQGCVISVNDDDHDRGNYYHSEKKREQKNKSYIATLSAGTDISLVKSALGTPDFSEMLMKEDKEYKVLFYRTQHVHSDGNTSKDECTPLVFNNGELVGYGDTAIQHL